MAIEVSCIECKQKMVNSVLEHLETCSARKLEPVISTGYLRPPAMVIKFGSEKERKKFMKGLNGSGGSLAPLIY